MNSAIMITSRTFRSIQLNERLLLRLIKTPPLQRTFLSEAYQCQEEWDKRLQSNVLMQIKPIDFFLEIDQKYQSQKKITALDVDIFANKIEDGSHCDELADILHKLRMTRDTTFTLDSTHHAVIRYYIRVGEAKQVLDILNDRLNYGIFCDHFCYNLLMDHFIKKQDYGSAAQVATFLMLQEDFEHPICNTLALYSCHKYLEDPSTWQGVDPETLKEPEPKEEVKIRVRYIRNPFFDDHFDLWKASDLVGKTLFWIGQTMNDPIGRSCHLRGLVLYKKYSDAISLIKEWKQNINKEIVYKDVLTLIKKDVPEIFAEELSEDTKELKHLLLELENADLCQRNFEDDLESLVKKAVEEHSENDIAKQRKLYADWETNRLDVIKEQLAEIDRQARLAKIEELKKDMIERERLLTFFENEEKIELQIEQKLEKEKLLYGEEQQTAIDEEENYVPPEIVKKRQNQ